MFDAIKSWLSPKPVVTCSGSLRGEITTSRRVMVHKGFCHDVRLDIRNNGKKRIAVELVDAANTYNWKQPHVVALKILDPGEASMVSFHESTFANGIAMQCREIKQGDGQAYYQRMERNHIAFCVSFMFTE